ncbi:hypothetical protein INT46_008586 [Mucor plumbeus]|uniref:Uncharacterized protein n=1 Tax=Mucor plumbeus TaxID=97098 RepID=A0A8H7QBY8_9FUNG|nr:hypothetical protein INT46_008586 [Mucor plumbeus]
MEEENIKRDSRTAPPANDDRDDIVNWAYCTVDIREEYDPNGAKDRNDSSITLVGFGAGD